MITDQFGKPTTEDEDLKVVEAMESLTQHPGWPIFVRQVEANLNVQRMRLERPEVQRSQWQTDDYLKGACFAFRVASVLPQVARKQYDDNQERLRMETEIDKESQQGLTPAAPFRDTAHPEGYGEDEWH